MIKHTGTDDSGTIIVNDTEAIRCVFDKPYSNIPRIVIAPGNRATCDINHKYELCMENESGFCILFRDPGKTYTLRYFVRKQ